MSTDKKSIIKELEKIEKKLKKNDEKAIICYKILKEAYFNDYPDIFKYDYDVNLDEINIISKIKELPSELAKNIIAKKISKTLIEKGEYLKAINVLKLTPEKQADEEAFYLTGLCFYRIGNYNEAKKYLEKTKIKDAEKLTAYCLSKLGRHKEAGKLFKKLGIIDEAIEEFLQSGDLKECNDIAHKASERTKIELLRALIKNNMTEECEKLIETLTTESTKTLLYEKLNFIKHKVVKDPKLLENILKDLEETDLYEALELLIEHYNNKGDFNKATKIFEEYKKVILKDDKLKLKYATTLKGLEDYKGAIKLLALIEDPDLKKKAKEMAKEIKKINKDPELTELYNLIFEDDSIIKRLKEKITKSKDFILTKILEITSEKTTIDEKTIEDVRDTLISFDVSPTTAIKITESLKNKVKSGDIKLHEDLIRELKNEIIRILKDCKGSLNIAGKPAVILVVGVNGTGKTTTIAKLANKMIQEGKKVILCAGDTFRAAGIEQLEEWGKRLGIPVVKQKPGADPSGVVYDSINIALSKNFDIVVVDTAGRLHTKQNLMEELKKIRKVIEKLIKRDPDEVLLVIDAISGQNTLSQVRFFHECISITGIILTKLDSTAKGGIIISIADNFKIPIKFIGTGEKLDDIEDFDPERFVDALFD